MNIKKALGIVALGLWATNLGAQSVNTVIDPALNAFATPVSVAVDGGENLYISDSEAHHIVRYTATNGIMRILAGTTGEFGSRDGAARDAQFFAPQGVVYARGGLFVADSGNHTIRFINPTANTVTMIAGSARVQGTNDGPGLSARFRSPMGLAADTSGNIYVADSRNGSIRVIDTANNVRTLKGGFNRPNGVAVTESNELIVVDRAANQVLFFDAALNSRLVVGTGEAGFTDGFAHEASFSSPHSVMWLGTNFGAVITDFDNHTLRRITYPANPAETVVSTYSGAIGQTNTTDGPIVDARFKNPTGMARYQSGFLVVDSGNNSVRQVLTAPQLPRINNPIIGYIEVVVDPDSGQSKLQIFEVKDQLFENDLVIGILGEGNVVNYYTYGPAQLDLSEPDTVPDPRTSQTTAQPYRNGAPPSDMPPSIVPRAQPDLIVKSQSRATGRTPSEVAQAIFRFKVGAPRVDASNPNAIAFRTTTTNATIFYTIDGSEPTEGFAEGSATQTNRNSLGPKTTGDTISIPLTGGTVVLKTKAFRNGYRPSDTTTIELSQETITPNRISFGFSGGEASSKFEAAAGQTFYAPVTLTVLPQQQMHGLQFGIRLQNGTGPAPASPSDYNMSFDSMLVRQFEADFDATFIPIPPQAFVRYENRTEYLTNIIETTTNIISGVTNVVLGSTNVTAFTNIVTVMTNLVTANLSQGLLSVGWLEHYEENELFESVLQHLISRSAAHDTIFDSDKGKVIVGAYSFKVPATAVDGQTYKIKIERPSATYLEAQDVYIEAPYETNQFTTLRAVTNVTVRLGQAVQYVVGDGAPFRWLNAGDFGDTNLLNNDVMQVFQTASYFRHAPPSGTDFFDAMDSCCLAADLSVVDTGTIMDGNDTNTINSIVFGDGVLDIRDVLVTYRRSLDRSLKWYARYWNSSAARAFVEVPNQFRGDTTLFSSPHLRALSTITEADAGPASIAFTLGSAIADAGGTVTLPLKAAISGGTVRGLMFSVVVEGLHAAPSATKATFHGTALGEPLFSAMAAGSGFSGAWMQQGAGLTGEVELGIVTVTLPTNAPAASRYVIRLENVSATGDGVTAFSVDRFAGLISVGAGVAPRWTDDITAEWRQQYFGSVSHPLSAPSLDPDSDGLTNLQEFLAGTSPIATTSRFTIEAAQSGVAGAKQLVIRWQGVAGKRYEVQSSTNLSEWTAVGSPIEGAGQDISVPVTETGASQFYRVRLTE